MHESEPPKKIKKRVQVQMSVDEELAKKQLDEREEVAAKVDQAHDIDWSDPAILRYHTLQNRPFSVAEVRKNMCLYLKNQGGYKMSHFKRMSYEDIRPIFERLWDQNQAFIPVGSEIEKDVMKRSGFDLQQESSKLVEEEIVQQDDVIAEQAMKESSRIAGGRRKKSLARKRARETLSEESAKKQKLEDDTEKEELQVYLNIIPEDEIHVLLMDTGFVIHMMVEKKYPLSQDSRSKMLSRKLEVDHQSDMGYELISTAITSVSTGSRVSTVSISLDLSRLATTLNRLERSIQIGINKWYQSLLRNSE
ncbi:hypothetical protein Tco_1246306 [Tanacetum coccineum]